MKIFIAIVYLNICLALHKRELDSERTPPMEEYGSSWMYMPDGDGIPRVAYLEPYYVDKGVSLKEAENINASSVTVYLYTRANPHDGEKIDLNNKNDLLKTKFDSTKPTRFAIHGWKGSYQVLSVQMIKDAYLESEDFNVFGVDWSELASNTFYLIPKWNTEMVGRELASFVDFLVIEGKANPSDIHIIGHSLGAHVAGFTGAFTKAGKIKRITGLDPAKPGFQFWEPPQGSLDPTDAEFVDVIHTCSGILGYSVPLGHVDFYPNGDIPPQPGCQGAFQIAQACSHGRSVMYFAESIKSTQKFMASKCKSWYDYSNGICTNTINVPMGDPTPPGTRGIFYLKTNSEYPFALN